MTGRKRQPYRTPKFPNRCDNCERDQPLQYYHYVLKGIFLCETCADLPESAVVRCKRKKVKNEPAK